MLRPTTDGLVTIRPPAPGDAAVLIAGRDDVFHRFLGEGSAEPNPVGCILVDDAVVGWVDYDRDRTWLEPGEVNVGYNVFATHRGRGHATRAVQLLIHHMAVDTSVRVATLLIDPANERSQALARRVGCDAVADLDGNPYFKRPVPPLEYSDGAVMIRRPRPEDIDADLAAKDDEQIDWLWAAGQREAWEAMSPTEQRAHALANLEERHDSFGTGPKWSFAVDTPDDGHVADVDCDLDNEHVPAGEANIAYWTHPAHRGHGHASRAVRLVTQFLADHTGAREAHLIVDAQNTASLRVADAIGAVEVGSWRNDRGRTMLRHILRVRG